jgi:hypothetical protein
MNDRVDHRDVHDSSVPAPMLDYHPGQERRPWPDWVKLLVARVLFAVAIGAILTVLGYRYLGLDWETAVFSGFGIALLAMLAVVIAPRRYDAP